MTHEPKPGVLMLEQAELILIMVEGLCAVRRPEGMAAADVLDQCDFNDETRKALKDTADRLVTYLTKAMNEGGIEATNMGVISPKAGVQ